MTAETPCLSTPGPAPLIGLLTRQRDLYVELKSLSDQQALLIRDGHTEQLLSLLAQRQRLVDQLMRLNRELATLRQQVGDVQIGLQALDRDRVRGLMDEVDGLLHAIIEQDDRDRQQLHAAQQEVGGEIRHAVRSSAAASAYRAMPAQAEARFTDRRG